MQKFFEYVDEVMQEEVQRDAIEAAYDEYYKDRYLDDYLEQFEENEREEAVENFEVQYTKEDIYNFVMSLNEMELEQFVPEQDLYVGEGFLRDVGLVYHQTEPKYDQTEEELVESIKETGLNPSYGSGLTNRGESAVFTSQEIDEMNTYGYMVIEINVDNMLNDGYITLDDLSYESEVTEYNQRVAIDYSLSEHGNTNEYDPPSSDMSSYTVLIRKNVPSKYIQIHNEDFEVIFTGERFK